MNMCTVRSACCRPSLQVNESVLRPTSMEPLLDLQLAEELIKQEMITMLHHDCLHHPSSNAASQLQRGKNRGPTSSSNNASHIAYLETHTYKPINTEEMEQVTPSNIVGQKNVSVNTPFDKLTDCLSFVIKTHFACVGECLVAV